MLGFLRPSGCIASALLLICLIVISPRADALLEKTLSRVSVSHPEEIDVRVPGSALTKAVAFDTAVAQAEAFRIELSGLATSDYYANFFQTSDGPRALRLELQHPNKLYLALGARAFVKVSDSFSLGDWHRIIISGQKNKTIDLSLDDARVYSSGPSAESRFDISFDKIVVGSGFARQRGLQGAVSDFSLSVAYANPFAARAIAHALLAFFVAVSASLLACRIVSVQTEQHNFESAAREALSLRLEATALCAVSALLLIGLWLTGPALAFNKWAVWLALALCFPGTVLAVWMTRARLRGDRAIELAALSLAGACLLSVLVPHVTRLAGEPEHLEFAFGVTLLAVVTTQCMRRRRGQSWPRRLWEWLLLFCVSAFTIAVLLATPNWQRLKDLFVAGPVTALLGLSLVLTVGGLCVRDIVRVTRPRAVVSAFRRPLVPYCLQALPYLILAMFSFRGDGLSVEGSVFHWSYFVLPIQAVREGGGGCFGPPLRNTVF